MAETCQTERRKNGQNQADIAPQQVDRSSSEAHMQCPGCGGTAPKRARFCPNCGTSLAWRCSCGSTNPPEHKFCLRCGTPKRTQILTADDVSAPTTDTAERRFVTVLFCDLVGSTELSRRLDPEDLRDVVSAYHRCVVAIAERHGGYVARFLGDGVLVYFGWPKAHEDDPERALRAGLGATEAVAQLQAGLVAAGSLQAHVGVATGPVVVGNPVNPAGEGDVYDRDVATGETPNLAARMESLAEPGTMVIAESTWRLTGDLFEYRDLGPHYLKGYAAPVGAWQVLRERPVASRFEALRGRAMPLVGRVEELRLLMRRWEQAKAGGGRVVLLSGEPGIGKSRLAAAVLEQLWPERHGQLRFFCAPHYQDSALHPVIAQMERSAEFDRDDDPPTKVRKLERWLAPCNPAQADLALIAKLLALPHSAELEVRSLTPHQERKRILAAILRQLQRVSLETPIIALVEDIHWADPTTLELLELVVECIGQMSVLLLVTARADIQVPWISQPEVSMLLLNRLDRRETVDLIAEVTGGRTLPTDVVEQIALRADGIPLFAEELTKTVLDTGQIGHGEGGTTGGSEAAILVPSTLQTLLMARLDRLGEAREVAQVGAVIGREFPFGLVRQLSAVVPERLPGLLGELASAGLIAVQGEPPEAIYTFKHALVQDAAYGSMLRDRRKNLHLRLAETLEQDSATGVQPEVLARHFAEAGSAGKAIGHYLKAAAHADGRGAVREMVNHLRRGLRLLDDLADSLQRKQWELALQTALGRGLIDNKGSGDEAGYAAFMRARELSLELNETDQLLPILYGLQVYHFTRSQPDMVLTYAQEILDFGRRSGNRQAVLTGHRVAGSAYLLTGRFVQARGAYDDLLALYDDGSDARLASDTVRDPKVAGCAFLGICLTALGHLDQGAACTLQSMAHAEALRHPISVAFGLRRGCIQCMLRRDVAGVTEFAGRLLAMSGEYETFLGQREGLLFQSWAALHKRREPALLAQLSAVLIQLDSSHMWAMLPYFMASGAEILDALGDHERGAALLERASELVTLTGEQWCEAEILRLRACLGVRGADDATSLLLRSIELAQAQGAKLWELRSATSLARHWHNERRITEARNLLAPVVAWFTEGVDAPDLRMARSLLDELC
ncbi:MAG TPA: adenylate/guanylate cyclase domain-containing protein [Acetobacteraceae bacterium]|nr:adenylate/guanylate cyclase domain-containing protein [Acetobacteraceae bacterium]